VFDAPFLSHLHHTLEKISQNQGISKPGLYLIGTPIGNLADMSLRGLAALLSMDVIFCEDTRVTQTLLKAYGLSKPLKPYHKHNAASTKQMMVDAIREGKAVGLVCDAGLPLVSDPGADVVSLCIENNLPIIVIPGASAGVTALMASGLSAEQFHFAGFLPTQEKERNAWLSALKEEQASLIFYEAPHRLLKTLKVLQEAFGERQAAVGRELTKKFEEIQRGGFAQLINHYKNNGTVKGEMVIVVAGQTHEAFDPGRATPLLKLALESLRVKDAAQLVSLMTGIARKDLYEKALEMTHGKNMVANNTAE
jgi:16S rRNA (cytidine1402-2'-O)-methyltransferase